jgi:hypothetical protein
MSEFVKISFPDILKYSNLAIDGRKGDKKSVTVFNQKEEEETSIYEYDYDCLKNKELLSHSCLEHRKEGKEKSC